MPCAVQDWPQEAGVSPASTLSSLSALMRRSLVIVMSSWKMKPQKDDFCNHLHMQKFSERFLQWLNMLAFIHILKTGICFLRLIWLYFFLHNIKVLFWGRENRCQYEILLFFFFSFLTYNKDDYSCRFLQEMMNDAFMSNTSTC